MFLAMAVARSAQSVSPSGTRIKVATGLLGLPQLECALYADHGSSLAVLEAVLPVRTHASALSEVVVDVLERGFDDDGMGRGMQLPPRQGRQARASSRDWLSSRGYANGKRSGPASSRRCIG